MQKEIFKQIIIILLACVAIMLAMTLIFYQYIPSNKVMPQKVQAYAVPDNIKTEIEEDSNQELTEQEQVFEVTDSDLDMYRSSKSYNPGKSDPFSSYSENQTTVESSNASAGTTVNQGSSNASSSSSNTTTQDSNTTDNYYTAANVSRGTK